MKAQFFLFNIEGYGEFFSDITPILDYSTSALCVFIYVGSYET